MKVSKTWIVKGMEDASQAAFIVLVTLYCVNLLNQIVGVHKVHSVLLKLMGNNHLDNTITQCLGPKVIYGTVHRTLKTWNLPSVDPICVLYILIKVCKVWVKVKQFARSSLHNPECILRICVLPILIINLFIFLHFIFWTPESVSV